MRWDRACSCSWMVLLACCGGARGPTDGSEGDSGTGGEAQTVTDDGDETGAGSGHSGDTDDSGTADPATSGYSPPPDGCGVESVGCCDAADREACDEGLVCCRDAPFPPAGLCRASCELRPDEMCGFFTAPCCESGTLCDDGLMCCNAPAGAVCLQQC